MRDLIEVINKMLDVIPNNELNRRLVKELEKIRSRCIYNSDSSNLPSWDVRWDDVQWILENHMPHIFYKYRNQFYYEKYIKPWQYTLYEIWTQEKFKETLIKLGDLIDTLMLANFHADEVAIYEREYDKEKDTLNTTEQVYLGYLNKTRVYAYLLKREVIDTYIGSDNTLVIVIKGEEV